jgi:hypothetical protein
MQAQENLIQLTFYYTDGRTEAFQIPPTGESLEKDIRQRLSQTLCVLQTPENTVFINMVNVSKVEVNPPIIQLQTPEVFPDAERLTPLTRGSRIL